MNEYEYDDFLLCLVLLSSVLQCCFHDVRDVEFSQIVQWVQKHFSVFPSS